MTTDTDINKRILESLEHLHIRLDNIELLLENKKASEKSPKKEGPSNHGARWTPEQEEWMLNAIAKNISIDKIAEKMERTRGGVRGRLLTIAFKMINDEHKTYEEVSKITSLSIEDIQTIIIKKAIIKNESNN
jgi:hypothetical protein